MIRPARYSDIKPLVALIDDARKNSRFSAYGLDADGVGRGLLKAVSAHDNPIDMGGMCCFVSESGNTVDGLILGFVTKLYEMLDLAVATDFIWYVQPEADPRSAMGLLRAFHKWAEGYPGPIIIRQSVNDSISDPGRSQALLLRNGMTCCGATFEKEIRT